MTQYITKLQNDQNLIAKHPKLITDMSLKLVHFPAGTMPESAIVRDHSIRSAFMRIFKKYIDEFAEWKICLRAETHEETLNSYRRLEMVEAEVGGNTSPFVPRLGSTFLSRSSRLSLISMTDHSVEMSGHLEMPASNPSNSMNRSREYVLTMTMLTMLMNTVDHVMSEVIGHLESVFDGFRKTEVTFNVLFYPLSLFKTCTHSYSLHIHS